MRGWARPGLLALSLSVGVAGAHGEDLRFCGGAVQRSDLPSDLAHVVGDQTVEYAVDQPASAVVCSAGYEAAKCGDFTSAYKIFDKCIAAGYVGAMIWKAAALENGAGGAAPDLQGAAELVRRAAMSGSSGYATLAKLDYARALYLGKGVPRDEAAARQWFEAAAGEGNEDAIAALRNWTAPMAAAPVR
ncbi:sel1 repeat family protein [Duganella sp. FT3S]|uniref:Sel1 repeat family protein n=1 Tax=Rugamonas fusca TaxID=2758568 RepID=A0A7W2EFY2_9BURK|nr:sel1 repeat family protein [Rugamonas fusca]MBA5604960.1 sel1 repeat family protein [Rugamonas fusca]